jgi:fibronectin type 3 domain-containing protein
MYEVDNGNRRNYMKIIIENWRPRLNEKILVLYHHTSQDNVEAIRATHDWQSEIHSSQGVEVYFSNKLKAHARGHGEEAIKIEIPEEYAILDDEFPFDDEFPGEEQERHYRIDAADLKKHARIKR